MLERVAVRFGQEWTLIWMYKGVTSTNDESGCDDNNTGEIDIDDVVDDGGWW